MRKAPSIRRVSCPPHTRGSTSWRGRLSVVGVCWAASAADAPVHSRRSAAPPALHLPLPPAVPSRPTLSSLRLESARDLDPERGRNPDERCPRPWRGALDE